MNQTPHVALLPSPGMGHLIPFIELAKQLVLHHHFSVTILIPSAAPPTQAQKTVLQTLPKTIHHIFLPPVHLPNDNLDAAFQIFLTATLSLPSLRHTLASLSTTTRLVSLIVDPFSIDAIDVAKEFGVSPYLFFPSPVMALLFCLHLPKLDETYTGDYKDLPEPLQLPGCVPVQGRDLPDLLEDRSSNSYKVFLGSFKRFGLAEGIIVNSFVDMEEGAIKALLVEEPGRPAVYPVGPLIRTVMLTEGLKVALCPKSHELGLVGREEIAEVVKSLMEGEEGKKVRQRMEGLKDAAAKVLSEEGSSTKSLSDLAFKWKNQSNI
ncbi:Hydroquinone glucosyltransferase [Camellia lanceoleosa]|uniref:Hydroquinone glucosyltransferase n=1 Tax=Camellia lanceoleosa TaxID=1840588 RepID=A0ACC0IKU5_9ERIC|nr:Hydroquinone glucosyltransferase [Camellia lanceoleosa]